MPKTICISAGHQPSFDNGAQGNGMSEAKLTIEIANRVVNILQKHSVPTLYVPNDISLTSTIKWINNRKNQINVAVDIHINSGGGTGWEAFYYGNGKNESQKLAQFLVDALKEEAGQTIRGVKSEYNTRFQKLGFIHDTIPLASLVECGFIDNASDAKLLKTSEGLDRIAKGVARGILGYIGVTWNPSLLNTTNKTADQKINELRPKVQGTGTINKWEVRQVIDP